MDLDLYKILPWIAALAFVAIGLMHASDRPPMRGSWLAPSALAALLFGWSAFTIAREGFAVWAEHTRNAWGNQIWFDPARWLLFVGLSGSIGLFAMLARCIFLEERRRVAAP